MDHDSQSRLDPETTILAGDSSHLSLLRAGEYHSPHSILGVHPITLHERPGLVVRTFHPDAARCELLVGDSEIIEMRAAGGGVFVQFLSQRPLPLRYQVRFVFADGKSCQNTDPYSFLPTIGDMDLHLFNEGTHRRLWSIMGARPCTIDGTEGTAFAVWAPNAKRASVVGDFNSWDGRLLPMRSLGSSGVWELFVPGVKPGAIYKFELKTQGGDLRLKTDPMAKAMELPPANASVVCLSEYEWADRDWMVSRPRRDVLREPMNVYEVHLGSWARVPEEGNRYLTYREIVPRLVEHMKRFGFTHIELMPIAEHAYYPSWGYQVTGYYAPTSRYGSPDDFKFFVDYCHQQGIGVILDWVPAHFPKDDWSLRRFDGTALYEHDDPRRGEHPDWGTLIFNFGRAEVKGFLIANALFWLNEYHVDALRVDAVASMLYLDYSRDEGQWVPNPYGGRENLEAIDFLRQTNAAIRVEAPGAFTIAEESTAWGGVSRPEDLGGLGFAFKWNMGWMHDTLEFFTKEAIHRQYHVDQLTFSMVYEYTERFINSISHDEVVHGKRSMIEKMPGDMWQKLANLRLLLLYQAARPGKQLIFMGTELAQHSEWNHETSLDWHLAEEPQRQNLYRFLEVLGKVYRETPALWRSDPNPESFEWIDFGDRNSTVLSFLRRDGNDQVIVVFNFTPVPRAPYRIGAPVPGRYVELISSDDPHFGGSEFGTQKIIDSEPVPCHNRAQSLSLRLPPLGAMILRPE